MKKESEKPSNEELRDRAMLAERVGTPLLVGVCAHEWRTYGNVDSCRLCGEPRPS